MIAPPAISLPRFDGPLDLLLSLIRKNQFEVHDLPVARITKQYLDYIDRAAELDLDLGADFIYMAATLIQIKSRQLLPLDPEVAKREPDPHQELVRQLMSHQELRGAAEFLIERQELSSAMWSHPGFRPVPEEESSHDSSATQTMSILDILELARQALQTARAHQSLAWEEDCVTVEQMVLWLERRLASAPYFDSLPADKLFQEQPDVPTGITLFLAMLEMSRRGDVELEQPMEFGPIYLTRSAME